MITLLPYDNFIECAKVLDNLRLNNQQTDCLVLLRSLTRVYPPKPRTGISGWENHTQGKFWNGYELQLSRYGLVIAEESLKNRSLSKSDPAMSLGIRKKHFVKWTEIVETLESLGFPDTMPPLIGDEEFHSAFRSYLLFRDCQAQTFKLWKAGKYPDHVVTRNLLPKKSSWKRQNFIDIWGFFGRPPAKWYSQFNWKEEPDDMKVFFSEDRVPQMLKEKQRKIEKPYLPYLKPLSPRLKNNFGISYT